MYSDDDVVYNAITMRYNMLIELLYVETEPALFNAHSSFEQTPLRDCNSFAVLQLLRMAEKRQSIENGRTGR